MNRPSAPIRLAPSPVPPDEYKRTVGPRLVAENEDARKVEAAAECNVLNRMLGLGRARSVRIVAAVDA